MSPLTGGGAGGGDSYTKYVSDYFTYRTNGPVGDSDFVATIQTLTPASDDVKHNVASAGDADYLTYVDTTNQDGMLVLHNTTRGDSALVRNYTSGTRTIRLSDDIPGTWVVGDTITLRSQVCDIGGSPYFFDIDMAAVVEDDIITAFFQSQMRGSTAGGNIALHPYETYSLSKVLGVTQPVANQIAQAYLPCAIVSQRVCVRCLVGGAGTANIVGVRVIGYEQP